MFKVSKPTLLHSKYTIETELEKQKELNLKLIKSKQLSSK